MDAQRIKELLENQKAVLFSGSLAILKEAERGVQLPMLNENNEQTHWFTSFILQQKVAGFAIQDLAGKVVVPGLLAPNAEGKNKIDPAFFLHPPAAILNEIKTKYAGSGILSRSFSYDQIPQRWAWRIKLVDGKGEFSVYITPAGWYEKKELKAGWEG